MENEENAEVKEIGKTAWEREKKKKMKGAKETPLLLQQYSTSSATELA